MSYQAVAAAIASKGGRSSERLVLIVFAHHANSKTGLAFLSQDRLARETGQDRETIRAAIRALESRHQLVKAGTTGRTGRIQIYRVMLQSTGKHADSDVQISGETVGQSADFPGTNQRKTPLQNKEVNREERGRALSTASGWLPSDTDRRFVEDNRPDVDQQTVLEKFRLHHGNAKQGPAGWSRAYRQWALREWPTKPKILEDEFRGAI